jgi:hypothetical protein
VHRARPDHGARYRVYSGMITSKHSRDRQHTLRSLLSAAWDSAMVRYTVLAVALGAVPVYFLSLATAQIGG